MRRNQTLRRGALAAGIAHEPATAEPIRPAEFCARIKLEGENAQLMD
jgi:hypothetical protein